MFNSIRNIKSNPLKILVFCGDGFLKEMNPGMDGKPLPPGDYQLYS